MAQCFNTEYNRYEYCPSRLSTYIAVGVIIPLIVLTIIGLVYLYLRCRRTRETQEPQQTHMNTVIPIFNNDDQQQAPYNYPYPPHYASVAEDFFDKPPSYQQTVEQVTETPNRTTDTSAVPPVTTNPVPAAAASRDHLN